MTEDELNRIYYLRKEIEMWRKKLDNVITVSSYGNRSGGSSCGYSSPVVRQAEKRDRIQKIISDKEEQLIFAEEKITEYIMSVDDSLIRMIMYKRHVELKTWACIACEIGNSTPDGLRMFYKRFRKKSEKK